MFTIIYETINHKGDIIMKRITSIILALLLILSLCACGKSVNNDEELAESAPDSSGSGLDKGSSDTSSGGMTGASSDVTTTAPGGSGGSSSSKSEGTGSYKEDSSSSAISTDDHVSRSDYVIEGEVTSDNGFVPDSAEDGKIIESGELILVDGSVDGSSTSSQQIQSGTLTAGEWKDTDNLNFWSEVINRAEIKDIINSRNINTGNVVAVKVTDNNGNPCFNAKVDLLNANNEVIYSAVSDVFGKAYLFYNLNSGDNDSPMYVSIGKEKSEIVKNGVTDLTINEKSTPVEKLDLMLMIDTTGSMGDELEYLKKELDNVINEVTKDNEALSVNISVNFYRDVGDEYEVKEYPFTEDIAKAVSQLQEQIATGGGDYPEAVHKALNSVVNNHEWRKDSVKLCFFVLDAPPHNEQSVQSINADMQKYVEAMAKQGIRIIPVASSGVDKETEILCRSWAMMTGGTYTFLTDHSGVGGSHIEPTIGQYEVEKLNALMIRVIKEYCGINK